MGNPYRFTATAGSYNRFYPQFLNRGTDNLSKLEHLVYNVMKINANRSGQVSYSTLNRVLVRSGYGTYEGRIDNQTFGRVLAKLIQRGIGRGEYQVLG